MAWHTAFAPATIANVGPGFDVLGMAIDHRSRLGDRSSVRLGGSGVRLSITGDGGRLSTDPAGNVATVAAMRVLALAGRANEGFELKLSKGLPLGSGLGSSAASAASAAIAMNTALGTPFTYQQLIPAARAGEQLAAGSPHADNVVPALLGGIQLIIDTDTQGLGADGSLQLVRVPRAPFWVVLAMPALEVSTAAARQAIPKLIPHGDAVFSAGRLALLVAAMYERRPDWLRHAVQDRLHEPYRMPLITGFSAAKARALHAGALAVGVSGSGPATFALIARPEDGGAVAAALREGFASAGVDAKTFETRVAAERRQKVARP